MDNRTLRSKKSKPRSARPYDRPNQSILGRVASKVKGLFNPSWILNVSQWMGGSSEEPGGTNTGDDDSASEDESAPQFSHGAKRPRLRLHDHTLNAGTQTWPNMPSSSNSQANVPASSQFLPGSSGMPSNFVFSQPHLLPPSAERGSLGENKESLIIMNGDDHSENSEGSASTSGCSSLVSHKDRSNCISSSNLRLSESSLKNLRSDLKDVMSMTGGRDVASQNEQHSGNVSGSRMSLWTSSFSPSANRSPSVARSNQPGFNVSAFTGPSRLNQQQNEKKVSSPFYSGRTTFGGASSSRKIPVSSAPYQVDKPLRNQIKVRRNESEDTLEGMSSAAKRILQTLEKMSSPLMDAKKIPNTDKSPVDLSLYLKPAKHRIKLQSTPLVPSKGPPIANISTISKLTTLKNCGVKRFQNSYMDSPPVTRAESPLVAVDAVQVPKNLESGGGGKMRNRLNQHHQSSKQSAAVELPDSSPLPNVPLPIFSLPSFNFDCKTDMTTNSNIISEENFLFSNPIAHVLPTSSIPSVTPQVSSVFGSRSDRNGGVNAPFTFSSPIELELPASSTLSANLTSLSNFQSTTNTRTWECPCCMIRNPLNLSKCLACNAQMPLQAKLTSTGISQKQPSTFCDSLDREATSPSCICLGHATKTCTLQADARNPNCMSKSCKAPIQAKSDLFKPASGNSKSFSKQPSTWECSACWIQNPVTEDKCLACETPKAQKEGSVESSSIVSTTPSQPSVNASVTVVTTWECSSCWVRNPVSVTECCACETARNPKENTENVSTGKKTVGSFFRASSESSSAPSSTSGSGFKFREVFNGPITQTACFGGFSIPTSQTSDTQATIKKTSEVTNKKPSEESGSLKMPVSGFGSSNEWECDTCLVRNSSDMQKCAACETLRPSKKNLPDMTSSDAFKFNCPVQSSLFKFSLPSSTALDTVTTATFSFGTPTSTTTTSKLLGVVTSSATSTDSKTENLKSAEQSKTGTFKSLVSETKAPKAAGEPQSKIPVVDLDDDVDGNAAVLKPKSMFAMPASKTDSSISVSTSSCNVTEPNSITQGTSFTTESKLSETGATKADQLPNSLRILEKLTKEEVDTFLSQPSKDMSNSGFNFKAPAGSVFGSLTMPKANKDAGNLSMASDKSSQPILASAGTKTDSPFLSGNLPQSASFKIESPVSSAKLLDSSAKGIFLPTIQPVTTLNTSETKDIFSLNKPQHITSVPSFDTSSAKNAFSAAVASGAAAFSSGDSKSVFTVTEASNTSAFRLGTAPMNTFYSRPNKTQKRPAESDQPPFSSKLQDSQAKSNVVSSFSVPTTMNSFAFGSAAVTTTTQSAALPSGFTFFPSTTSAAPAGLTSNTSVFSFGLSTNTAQAGSAAPSGFTFRGGNEEKPKTVAASSLNFSTPVTSSSAAPIFSFGSNALPAPAPSTGGFSFGNVPAKPTPNTFTFGSGSSSTTNQSTFTAFQPSTPFQFGSQPSSTSNPAPAFGSGTTGFAGFGTKTETPSQLPGATSQPAPAFGSVQPIFGNATQGSSTFGKIENPGGFNFAAAASASSPVFQFGNTEKKQAIPQQFSFGTPVAQEIANPAAPFNISTPPSFNFGASATSPAGGPFQFAANTDGGVASAPRKIRKAVRRTRNAN